MKEIIEKLRRKSQAVPVPLELPDEDLLVEIEEQILIPLPSDLKQFLLSVSDLVCGSLEPITATDPHSHTFLPEVAAEAWACGLPRDLIPVCQARGGYYAIDDGGSVAFWCDGQFEENQWDSIWDWAEAVWLES